MMTDPRGSVDITVMQRTDKSLYYQMDVRGAANPSTIMRGILEVGTANEPKAVMLLAGALAEELIERVGDSMLDPDLVAHTAEECYRDLIATNPHITVGTELPRYADSSSIHRHGGVGLN